ncbi:MAG: methyltransferase domain-containing protein [Anaerolineaceae bacterium]|nr:MAG: methyltransferase domain-containing protein [Anaerolineaceae bacterium]
MTAVKPLFFIMRLITRFLDFFFQYLYHGLAFTYDLVAWIVSFGQWIEWTKTVIPHLHGPRVLELGHGPGHLQRIFLDLGLAAFGLDESSQMSHLAHRRLLQSGYAQPNLAGGLGQALPFATESFDSIVATFPAPYIAEARTLSEARRVLRNGGRLIVLPAAWPKNRLLRWLYRVTGESPAEGVDILKEKVIALLSRAGFEARVELLDLKSSELLLILAQKTAEG